MLLKERQSNLDVKILKKLGITLERVTNVLGLPNILFFHQFLLPICDRNKVGIKDDGRVKFYDRIQICFILYQIINKIGTGYRHDSSLRLVEIFVKFGDIVVRAGLIYMTMKQYIVGYRTVIVGIT